MVSPHLAEALEIKVLFSVDFCKKSMCSRKGCVDLHMHKITGRKPEKLIRIYLQKSTYLQSLLIGDPVTRELEQEAGFPV